jgi:hypothetical protein
MSRTTLGYVDTSFVLKVTSTTSFFPAFHTAGQSTELWNVGLCARCACLDVFNSVVSYGGHLARNFVTSTRFPRRSLNRLLSSPRTLAMKSSTQIAKSNNLTCLYETCLLEALVSDATVLFLNIL